MEPIKGGKPKYMCVPMPEGYMNAIEECGGGMPLSYLKEAFDLARPKLDTSKIKTPIITDI